MIVVAERILNIDIYLDLIFRVQFYKLFNDDDQAQLNWGGRKTEYIHFTVALSELEILIFFLLNVNDYSIL